MTPIFIGMVQSRVNELVDTRATTAPCAGLSVLQTPSRGLSGGSDLRDRLRLLDSFHRPFGRDRCSFLRKTRDNAQRMRCTNNLRQIDMAKDRAGLEHEYVEGDTIPEQVLSRYMKEEFPKFVCPKGGHYSINPLGQDAACSEHGSTSDAM